MESTTDIISSEEMKSLGVQKEVGSTMEKLGSRSSNGTSRSVSKNKFLVELQTMTKKKEDLL